MSGDEEAAQPHERRHLERSRCPHCPFEPVKVEARAAWCPCGGPPIGLPGPCAQGGTHVLRCENCLHFVRVHDAPAPPRRRPKKTGE